MNKITLLVAAFTVTLSAKCQSPEFPKGSIDKDITASFAEASKGIQVKLHTDSGLTFEGTAKGSLASSSYTILLDKECNSSGECFKIKGFVSNGEISALKAKIDPSKDAITILSGTKFEVVKGYDERWAHLSPSDKMPDCNSEQNVGH